MGEDRPLEVAQHGPRFHPQALGHDPPRVLVGRQRLTHPARPVPASQQLRPPQLPVRLVLDELRRQPLRSPDIAEGEQCGHFELLQLVAQLLGDPRRDRVNGVAIDGERGTTPQRERGLDEIERTSSVGVDQVAGTTGVLMGDVDVQPPPAQVEVVTPSHPLERRSASLLCEGSTERAQVDVQGRARRLRWSPPPQHLGQVVDVHRPCCSRQRHEQLPGESGDEARAIRRRERGRPEDEDHPYRFCQSGGAVSMFSARGRLVARHVTRPFRRWVVASGRRLREVKQACRSDAERAWRSHRSRFAPALFPAPSFRGRSPQRTGRTTNSWGGLSLMSPESLDAGANQAFSRRGSRPTSWS